MDPVRLGIIGCGGMGRFHGHVFTQDVPEAEIVALADPDPNNLALFQQEVFQDGKQPEGTFAGHQEIWPLCRSTAW